MDCFLQILYFVIGLIFLVAGADLLIKGARNLALNLGIRPIIIGLTVVAYGTSLPEFVASLISNMKGSGDIAIGNVVGSNIANFGLVLGIMAMLKKNPVKVDKLILKRDYWIMVAASVLFFVLCRDLYLDFYEGILLFILVIVFTIYLYRYGGQDESIIKPEKKEIKNRYCILYIIAGSGVLWFGSETMINAAVTIAKILNVPELVIGLTIVAVGTSLPELATSIISILKKESDIAIGNLVGSNIFNIFFVIGGVSLIKPLVVDKRAFNFDIPFMILFLVAIFPLLAWKQRISQKEGLVLLCIFLMFVVISYTGLSL